MTDWEDVYKELSKGSWFILLITASLSYFLLNHRITLGVILGGLIIIANFSFLHSTIRKAIPVDGKINSKKSVIVIKSFLRLLILGILIYVLITRGLVNPIGLTIGLSTIVLSIVCFGVKSLLKSRFEGAI